MRIATLCFFLLLLSLPATLLAAPGDAAAVLTRCGTPTQDSLTSDSSDYLGQQRVLAYRQAQLHFEHDGPGWNFIFAGRGTHSGLSRTQVEQFMPCFGKAMYDVQLALPLNSLDHPALPLPPPTRLQQFQHLTQQIHLTSPYTIGLLVFLYLLPSLIGIIRSSNHLVTLVIIDLFLGWTVIGWLLALVLALGERDSGERDSRDSPLPDSPPPRGGGLDSIGGPLSDPTMIRPTAFRPAFPPVIPSATPIPAAQAFQPETAKAFQAETPRGLLRFSTPSKPAVPANPAPPPPQITWEEEYRPRRPVRIEYAEDTRRYTIYNINLSSRGMDEEGNEYLGGYSGKTFMTFRTDRVLHLRDTNIA